YTLKLSIVAFIIVTQQVNAAPRAFNSARHHYISITHPDKHAVKSRTTEKSSEEDIINILKEVTTRTRICFSRVNLKTRYNTPWKDSLDKNPKENSNNIKHKSADAMRKCHIYESTTHLANTCPKKGKVKEIDIKKEPDVEKDETREALEIYIKELLDLGILRKVGHNEEVEITTPVIVAWNNGKSRMVGDFGGLNTYTVPDRYPIPKIKISLTQISQAVYISTMDSPTGFHQDMMTPRPRKYLRIVVDCGCYKYLRMPFGIKNALSHFQRMTKKSSMKNFQNDG
ncbi:hypothetical protein O181_092622, partial [Austropuccinia psidii MF-1]|nr:hypothetical protein [Austropuccinia psidii MF-1]